MKKKIITLLLACSLTVATAACGADNSSSSSDKKDNTSVTEDSTDDDASKEDPSKEDNDDETDKGSDDNTTNDTNDTTNTSDVDTGNDTAPAGCYSWYGELFIPDLEEIYPLENAEYTLNQINNSISCEVRLTGEFYAYLEIDMCDTTNYTSAKDKADENMAVLTDYDYQPTTFAGLDTYLYEFALDDTQNIISAYFEIDNWIYFVKITYNIYSDDSRTQVEALLEAIVNNMVIDEASANARFGIQE